MSIYHINWCRIFSINTLSTEFNWDARKKGSLQVPMPMRESNVHHLTLVFQWSFHQVSGSAKGKQPWFFLQESKPRVSNITWKSPKITVSDLDRLSLVVYPSYLPWTFHCILGNKSNLCPSTPNMGLLFFSEICCYDVWVFVHKPLQVPRCSLISCWGATCHQFMRELTFSPLDGDNGQKTPAPNALKNPPGSIFQHEKKTSFSEKSGTCISIFTLALIWWFDPCGNIRWQVIFW